MSQVKVQNSTIGEIVVNVSISKVNTLVLGIENDLIKSCKNVNFDKECKNYKTGIIFPVLACRGIKFLKDLRGVKANSEIKILNLTLDAKGAEDLNTAIITVKKEITLIEKEKELKEMNEAKKEEFFTITDSTSYNLSSSNKFASNFLKTVSKKHKDIMLQNTKVTDTYYGDYIIETTYQISMSCFLANIKTLEDVRKAERKEKNEKEIKELEKKIENKDVAYRNIHFVDADLCTGATYYTFTEKVSPALFAKVSNLFEKINTRHRGDDFDSMHESGFIGYATRYPKKVCEKLYPSYIQEGIEEIKKEIERLR